MRRILFPAPSTFDLLDYERNVYIDEILRTRKLMFASFDASINAFGIVDPTNPRTATPSSGRPLSVSLNGGDASKIDIAPGTVVFANGEVIELAAAIQAITLANGFPGVKNVVYLQFSEEEILPVLTRYDTLTNSEVAYLTNPADYIKVLARSDYDALTPTELQLVIPLAQVTPQTVLVGAGPATTTVLNIDMTRTSLATNRPWFSAVDVEHRSYVGTGIKSTTNPHAMSLNDISASSNQTLFQLLLDIGMVVAKDTSMAKVAGHLCSEEILPGALILDATGAVTGVQNARYFRLTQFPLGLLRTTDRNTKVKDFAGLLVQRKNLAFILPSDQYVDATDNGLEVTYIAASGAAPPVEATVTTFTVLQPDTGLRETVVAGGIVLQTINTPTIAFADAGTIPSKYTLYLDQTGVVQRYPQTTYCQMKLDDIGFATQFFNNAIKGRAVLRVGMTGAIPGLTLDVQLVVTGKDSAGATVSETFAFGSAWADSLVPTCAENPAQFLIGSTVFYSLDSWIPTVRVDDGPNTAIQIWAMIEPVSTPEISDVLPISQIIWDGLQVCTLEDIRPINTHLEFPVVTKYGGADVVYGEQVLQAYPLQYLFNVWVEDFNQPRLLANKVVDTTLVPAGLAPTSTLMRKQFDGLDVNDVYVSRPIAVRPHISQPIALRIIPIEPNLSFNLKVRYQAGVGAAWSNWVSIGSFDPTKPQFTIDLSTATSPLVKWQVWITGQCKGYYMVYIANGPGIPPTFIFDVGVWDDGSWS